MAHKCSVTINDSLARDDILLNLDFFDGGIQTGMLLVIDVDADHDEHLRTPAAKRSRPRRSNGGAHDALPAEEPQRYVFEAKDMPKDLKIRLHDVQLYVAKHVADAFGLAKGMNVTLREISSDNPINAASHVEVTFRDQYLSRADMWRIAVSELASRTVYKGMLVLFIGSIKAQISEVYVDGHAEYSAFIGKNTKPIFRSESARYVLMIQMSREMWDFDANGSGEIVFDRVVDGFLPALFKKWREFKVKHLVSVILFARVEYNAGLSLDFDNHNDYYTGVSEHGDRRPYKDFYRVVINEMGSGEWTRILHQLKGELNGFRQDINTHHHAAMFSSDDLRTKKDAAAIYHIKAESSRAVHGNILEAINLASSLLTHDYIDRDLVRTGISIAVVSPGSGNFEVEHKALQRTTEALVGNGIGVDLICVPKLPLHSVPLFRFRAPPLSADALPVQSKSTYSRAATPKQPGSLVGSYQSTGGSYSPGNSGSTTRYIESAARRTTDDWSFVLPQWLHVSYWTGGTADALSFQGIAVSVLDKAQQRADDFEVRCRMYELQMRSVLENSEIIIQPLPKDADFSNGRQHSSVAHTRGTLYNREVPDNLRHIAQGTQSWDASKNVATRSQTTNPEQAYDDAKARLPIRQRQRRTFPKQRGPEMTGNKGMSEQQLAPAQSPIKRRKSLQGYSVAPKGVNNRTEPPAGIAKRDSDASSVSSVTSLLRTPKFMRQISLGARGFGIATSHSTTAQVQAENISAATPSKAVVSKFDASKSRSDDATGAATSQRPHLSTRQSSLLSPVLTDSSTRQPIAISPAVKPHKQAEDYSLTATLRAKPRFGHSLEREAAAEVRAPDFSSSARSLRRGSTMEDRMAASPRSTISPWLTMLNPSNPDAANLDLTRLYSRWQHVFVRPADMDVMKWKTLCSPAAVPLTTEYFPTRAELDHDYLRQPYTVAQDTADEVIEEGKPREHFIRELISLRFSQGFQVVLGQSVARALGQKAIKISHVFSRDTPIAPGTSVFMVAGDSVHQLSCVNESEVEVTVFKRKPLEVQSVAELATPYYKPAIRTLLDTKYRSKEVDFIAPRDYRRWNNIDSFVAGNTDELSEDLCFWRTRYVLIPMASKPYSSATPGDNEEEVRLEGIRYLASQWLKHRWLPENDRRYQVHESRRKRDPNPLDIVYKTEDPSVIIAAELETLPLLEAMDLTNRKGHLIVNRDQFKKADFDVEALAEAMQQPPEKDGVRMQNRRWHLRLHYNCFIGSDMISWLLDHFEDLESREEAEALGQSLMADDEQEADEKDARTGKGLFVHVEKRHPFRDGQYFYQISSEYAKSHVSGWFGTAKKGKGSVPSTPVLNSAPIGDTNTQASRPGSTDANLADATRPAAAGRSGTRRPKVVLSKVMKYDVDPRKRSYRPERINLHYDRLHNPDNCYHIRIDWLNTTAKLIEDAIEGWARDMTRFGLRLVELPIAEACATNENNPFSRPYKVRLRLPPPDLQPVTIMGASSFAPHAQPVKHPYQKAILRHLDFVLDCESASSFPSTVDVTYSYGAPDFKYTQYIHRSGIVLAQITEKGDFLLLANRLYSTQVTTGMREREMRTESHPHHVSDRVGPAGARGATLASYTPYGINAEPTPMPSPSMRSTAFSSPMINLGDPSVTPSIPVSRPSGAAPPPDPEAIKDEVEAFCHDEQGLAAFYQDILDRATVAQRHSSSASNTPSVIAAQQLTVPDAGIPALGLGPPLFTRQQRLDGRESTMASPSTNKMAAMTSPGLMSAAAGLMRRGSVQHDA